MTNDFLDLITPAMAARMLGVTPARIRAMDDVLKPIRIAGSRFYEASAIRKIRIERDSRG